MPKFPDEAPLKFWNAFSSIHWWNVATVAERASIKHWIVGDKLLLGLPLSFHICTKEFKSNGLLVNLFDLWRVFRSYLCANMDICSALIFPLLSSGILDRWERVAPVIVIGCIPCAVILPNYRDQWYSWKLVRGN